MCESGTNAPDEPQDTLPATPIPGRSNASPGYATQQAHTPSSQPAKAGTSSVLPANRPGEVSKAFSPSAADPYGHLTEEQMAALNAELLQAEEQYSGRFREAEAIADPEQRRVRLDSLRNTFGTKQSMIRKKYGVRLRERRTRAEIQAERERMGRNRLKSEARNSGGEESPAPASSTASAWTAANRAEPMDLTDDATPSLKRRRVDEGNEYAVRQQTGPTTKVSEMAGGLAASNATAAVHDPTLPPPSSQPALTYQQAGARVEIHLPSKSSPTKLAATSTSGAAAANGSESREPDSMTPDADAMETDDHAAPAAEKGLFVKNGDAKEDKEGENASEKDNEVINIDDDDSDDDDDGDIPASLPPSVRQSLTSSQLGLSH